MNRIQRWVPIFLLWPKRVSGKWYWLKLVMRKGTTNRYLSVEEYNDFVVTTLPSAEQIANLTPYTEDEILEGDTDER